MTGTATHNDIMAAVEALAQTIGHEKHDENGVLNATGIFARFKVIEDWKEDRTREVARFKRDITVATAIITVAVTFFAWLESDRIDNVRKILTTPVAEAKQ